MKCKHGESLIQVPSDSDWKIGCAKNYVCACQPVIPLGRGKMTDWRDVAMGKRKVAV